VAGIWLLSETRKSAKITIATGCRAVADNRKINSTKDTAIKLQNHISQKTGFAQMKSLAIAAFSICLLFNSAASHVQAQSVFADKNLEKVVRKYVFAKRNNEEPLTEADVENISSIEGSGVGITNLAGLEKCRSLAQLILADNEITDVGALTGLKNIQSLNLAGNKIADLSAIANLEALQYLKLSNNEISDLAPLKSLANLRSLYLSGNQIQDTSAIAELTKLWSLYLDGNKITKIDSLSGLTRVSSLDLRNNKVTDLAPLAKFTELKYLLLTGNEVIDLGVLVEMATVDNDGQKRFSPFWKIYVSDNPLGRGTKKQLNQLRNLGARIHNE